MARPESINDIPMDERTDLFAQFYLDKISASPLLLKYYAQLLGELEKVGGSITRSDWSLENVSLYVNKDSAQLKYMLKQLQERWDRRQESYNNAVLRDGVEDLKEWQRDDIRKWAEEEGLPDPFDPFAATNDELIQIRRDLQMSDD